MITGTFFLTEDLKFVDVTIISNAECFAVYDIITDCHLCIDTAGGTAGVCSVSIKFIKIKTILQSIFNIVPFYKN
jgi:hypothetical protein